MSKQRPRVSLTDANELFALENQARRYTKSTLVFYRASIGRFVGWCETNSITHVQDVSPFIIRKYLIYLQSKDWSSHTVNKEARGLRRFLNFCVEEKFITESPMKKGSVPKADNHIMPSLTLDMVKRLLNACLTDREEAVVLFLLDTGVRASEFVNLNWGDVDLKTGEIIVRQGKGQKDRIVFLGVKARKKLLRYYIEREKPVGKVPVWKSQRTKKRLTVSGLFQLLRRIARRAEVEHFNPHTFRRTFAMWSLRAGMDIYSLKGLMGHADLATLLKYLGLTKEDLQRAHDKYGAVDNML